MQHQQRYVRLSGFLGNPSVTGETMDKHAARLAIPVLRSRVAPVFNWCSKMQIFLEDSSDFKPCREIIMHNINAFGRLKVLQHENVHTLICGALSPDLFDYGGLLGLFIIDGISGEVCEVLEAYRTEELSHPRFRLPGCRRHRKQRRTRSGRRIDMGPAGLQFTAGQTERWGNDFEIEVGITQGYTRRNTHGAEEQGYCMCPQCGAAVPRAPGIPCSKMACSKCGLTLYQVDSIS